ncbi:MAG: triphosphoribosyl-dephospho-CoA synthase [Gemmataceae bacterium]
MTVRPVLDIGLCAQVACIWEATARKPGNVHRYQDFADTTYLDFVLSAAAVAPVLATAPERRVGDTILACVQATRQVVSRNTNLGIILLLAPLAAVPPREELRSGVERVLSQLDVADSRAVFAAIRLAQPGGLGQVGDQDVASEPTLPLRVIMALAADRDRVARQYIKGFHDVFTKALPALRRGLELGSLEEAIIYCHLRLLAQFPDSLITRKRGLEEAEATRRRAQAVLNLGWPKTEYSRSLLADFDAWLRADGNGRNPGTSADLVTATLFVALREGILKAGDWRSEAV